MFRLLPLRIAVPIFSLALFPVLPHAQPYGTVSLPAELADPGATVAAVLIRNPAGNRPLTFSEGPAVDSQGTLYFAECGGDMQEAYPNRIWKVTPAGEASIFYSAPTGANGMEFDTHGLLMVCLKDSIAAFSADGKHTVVAASTSGMSLKRVNDLSIGSDGSMYFTNHSTGNEVFFRNAAGKITKKGGFAVPNGVEWIEEDHAVYVTLSTDTKGKVIKLDAAADGTLSNQRDFAAIAVPDGLTADEKGDLYVASWSEGAIHVFDKTGQAKGTITIKSANPDLPGPGGNTSNCVFGGPGNKTLYITGNGGCYKVQLKVAGRKRPASTAVKNLLGPAPDRRGSLEIFDPAVTSTFLYRLAQAAPRRLFDARGQNRLSPR
jgi:gluconolactonase